MDSIFYLSTFIFVSAMSLEGNIKVNFVKQDLSLASEIKPVYFT